MLRTKTQNKRLYGLMSKLGINEDTKEALVFEFTNGRTVKSSEMEYRECNNLIAHLQREFNKINRQKADILQKQRRNIFKLMYDIGLIDGNMTSEQKIGIINRWIKHKQNIDKTLNELNIDELLKTIKQLQAVRRRYNDKAQFQAKYN